MTTTRRRMITGLAALLAMGCITVDSAMGEPARKATASNVYANDLKTFNPQYAVDGNPGTRWATDYGTHQAWLDIDLGEAKTFDQAAISEGCGQRVEQFELQAKEGDGWRTFAQGQKIGQGIVLDFAPVTAQVVRLNINKAKEGPTISEIDLRTAKTGAVPLRQAINDLTETFGPQYPKGPEYLSRLQPIEKKLRDVKISGDETAKAAAKAELAALRREALLANPLLNLDKLLFVRRITYQSSHIYTDHFDGSHIMGGNLCILSPVAADGKVTEIVPELNGGLFGRYDLSFDGKRIVFAYKKPGAGYRIYEVGVDGAAPRQLTHDGDDESAMFKRYNHGYDDMDPCYLPDGKIMFASTRSKRAVLCHNAFTSTAIHLMDADGGNMRCVSGNTVNEFAPCTMSDGRVIYTRWEYVDKGCGDVQSLWSMHPDGSAAAHVYKNNVSRPATLIDARSVPGSNLLVAVGAPHMPLAVGPVILIDTRISQRTQAAMTNITPELGYPGHGNYPGGKFGYYKEPFPLSDKYFLVSYNPSPRHNEPKGYGLYLLDTFGNRVLIYQDAELSSFQPMPLRSRPKPSHIPPVEQRLEEETQDLATVFLADVYRGLTGIPRGTVKYLRVMEDMPKPWEPSFGSPGRGDSHGLQNPAISLNGHFTVKRVYGVAPVHEDGSAYFTVPAEKNLYFQVLDEDFMELQRMRTFVNLMPGEKRSCIGCHELRKTAAAMKPLAPMALDYPVQHLSPQPGDTGPRTVHYPTDVQPTLDKHCIQCHGTDNPQGDLDLTGTLTTLFNRSYENLIGRKLINNINVDPRDAYIPAEPPLTFGSHRSKLIERIAKTPCRAEMSREEFIRLVTWIDANAPYYGMYGGKRNLKWKDDPDFRPKAAHTAAMK